MDYSHPPPTLNLAKVNLKPVATDTLKPAPANLKPAPARVLPVGSLMPVGPKSQSQAKGLHVGQTSQPPATGLQAFLMQQKLKPAGSKPPQGVPKNDQVVPQLTPPQVATLNFIKKEPKPESTADLKPAMTVDTKVAADDVEMLSAKSVKDEKPLSILTDATSLGAPVDVDMPSAKTETQPVEEETKKVDPKVLLKEAILKAGIRRQQQAGRELLPQ